jgi:hypothetical protein
MADAETVGLHPPEDKASGQQAQSHPGNQGADFARKLIAEKPAPAIAQGGEQVYKCGDTEKE